MDLSGVSAPLGFFAWTWPVVGGSMDLSGGTTPQFGFGLDFGSTLVFFLNLGVGPGL